MSTTTWPDPPPVDQLLVDAARAWLAGTPLDAAGNPIDVEHTWATMPPADDRDDHQWIAAVADLVDAASVEPALEPWLDGVTLWRTLDVGDYEGFQVVVDVGDARLSSGFHEIPDSWADGSFTGLASAVDALVRIAGMAAQIRDHHKAPADHLAERVLEAVGHIAPRRIAAARRGTANSHSVTIPWHALLPLLDELEQQYPGALDRYRTLMRDPDR